MLITFLIFVFILTFVKLRKPNFVVFLVDDLGYGDLSCYGNDSIKTPAIDKLAKEGIQFNQFISSAPICTPSRAGLLTGRYPIRSGMTSKIDNFRTLNSPGQSSGLPNDEITIASLLKKKGYSTGMVGKWHLGMGDHLPTKHGFDEYYGIPVTNVQSCAGKTIYHTIGGNGLELKRNAFQFVFSRLKPNLWYTFIAILIVSYLLKLISFRLFFAVNLILTIVFLIITWYTVTFTLINPLSCILLRNEEIIEQPVKLQNLTVQNTNEAINFIKKSKDKPFFLYMSFIKVHTALFNSPKFDYPHINGKYGTNVEELDWSVGELMKALKQYGIDDNTMIFFSSDNGPYVERGNEAGSCGFVKNKQGKLLGPLKGAKGQTYECGIRIPGILRYKDGIKTPKVLNEAYSMLDVFPTIAAVANVELPKDRIIDGKSLVETFNSTSDDTFHDNLIHYCGSWIAAVRFKHYKAHFYTPNWENNTVGCPSSIVCGCTHNKHDPPLLYDIDQDPIESNPLPYNDKTVKIIEKIISIKDDHFNKLKQVPSQLHTLANPLLYPCCNPKKEKRSKLYELYLITMQKCKC